MNTTKDHYDQQLASVYSWMAGTAEAGIQRNRDLFRQLGIVANTGELAVDLGAGSGFQSIPLAELGYAVVAIDFCEALLVELRDRTGHLAIRSVHDDILDFPKHIESPAQLIICMGDTLPHLASLDQVKSLLSRMAIALAMDGKIILTFRDYVSTEPSGTQRFIPVRSDDATILTCFLEYHADIVEVSDLLYRKEGDRWVLTTSSYAKLRIDQNWLCQQLQAVGLTVMRHEMINGMVSIAAQKSVL
jgi:SAM-dependent methyltransferase